MDKDIEQLIINTSRKTRNIILAYCIVGILAFLGWKYFWIVGLIVGIVLGTLTYMLVVSMRGVRVWNTCEKDYQFLMAKGWPRQEALLIISKSFNNKLSDNFHQKVVDKFPDLNQLVVFYTGALPENTKTEDEEWAIKCLEKTRVEKQHSGTYKAITKW